MIGLSVAAILAISAIGLAIIFGVCGVINMAHGQFIMVGLIPQRSWGNSAETPSLLSQLPSSSWRYLACWLSGESFNGFTIALWKLSSPPGASVSILEVLMKVIFGPELYYVGAPKVLDGGLRLIGRLPYPYYRLFLIAVAIVMVVITFLIIYRTNFELQERAVRRNRAMTGCLGIDTAKIDMLIFMYGSGLAGIAGAVLAPIKSVSTTMGFSYAVGSYMVIVLGGVGNLLGVPRLLPSRRRGNAASL